MDDLTRSICEQLKEQVKLDRTQLQILLQLCEFTTKQQQINSTLLTIVESLEQRISWLERHLVWRH